METVSKMGRATVVSLKSCFQASRWVFPLSPSWCFETWWVGERGSSELASLFRERKHRRSLIIRVLFLSPACLQRPGVQHTVTLYPGQASFFFYDLDATFIFYPACAQRFQQVIPAPQKPKLLNSFKICVSQNSAVWDVSELVSDPGALALRTAAPPPAVQTFCSSKVGLKREEIKYFERGWNWGLTTDPVQDKYLWLWTVSLGINKKT